MIDHEPANVFVVDNRELTLAPLVQLLRGAGYSVVHHSSADDAVGAAEAHRADLILIWIDTPGMPELTALSRPGTTGDRSPVPVIILGRELNDGRRAFEAGAVDYLREPFDDEEGLARISVRVAEEKVRQALVEQNDALVQIEAIRDGLLHMIVHDLKSPLSAILVTLQLMEMTADPADQDGLEDLHRAVRSTLTLNRMVESLLLINHIEGGQFDLDRTAFSLGALIAEAADTVVPPLDRARVSLPPRESDIEVFADRELMMRTLENLFTNAIRHSPSDAPISVEMLGEKDFVRVSVTDMGPEIPPEAQDRIFEKLGEVEARVSGTRRSVGLGLIFCRLAVEVHHGTVGVTSQPGRGSTFWFQLPRTQS